MGEKTTIEIENLQALKQHALDTRKTLKQLINEAIEEKIQRERESMGMPSLGITKNKKPKRIDNENNPPSLSTQDKLSGFKQFLNERGLTAVIEKELGKYFITINDITPEKVTPELVNDVREAITMVYDEDTAELVVEKLQSLGGL